MNFKPEQQLGSGFRPRSELKTKLSMTDRTFYNFFLGKVRPRINDLTTKINITDRYQITR